MDESFFSWREADSRSSRGRGGKGKADPVSVRSSSGSELLYPRGKRGSGKYRKRGAFKVAWDTQGEITQNCLTSCNRKRSQRPTEAGAGKNSADIRFEGYGNRKVWISPPPLLIISNISEVIFMRSHHIYHENSDSWASHVT